MWEGDRGLGPRLEPEERRPFPSLGTEGYAWTWSPLRAGGEAWACFPLLERMGSLSLGPRFEREGMRRLSPLPKQEKRRVSDPLLEWTGAVDMARRGDLRVMT